MVNKFSFILLLIYVCCYSQEKDRVVARIGNYEITESEFRERFDFSIHPGLLQKANRDSIKLNFLNQLIAEKLLSAEACDKGYDTLKLINDILTPLENIYARELLYKFEIKNKVSVAAEDILTGLQRIKKILQLKFIFSGNESELQNIHNQLLSGASFDSLLSLRKEKADQSENREITFGTMDKTIEDSVYKLSIGEFTQPMQSQDGYYILKLVGVRDTISDKSTDMLAEDVRRTIAARNEFKHYLQYYRSFFTPFKISADRQIFEAVIPKFLSGFQKKYTLPDSSGKIILYGNEVTSASGELGNGLMNKTFIDLNGRSIKIAYFLNQLSHEGFSIKAINEMNIRASLSAYIRKFIEDELLTSEARKRGLESHEEVRRYMQMWKDSYLSKMMMLNIFDSLKTKNADGFTGHEKYYSEQVNIVEVLSDSLSTIEKVLTEISKGKDIKELARKHTIRDSLRARDGEFGFFSITNHGELGRAAAQMNIGDIYGPVRLNEGYSIFQLIDRKIDTLIIDSTPTDLKDQMIMQSALQNFENYVNAYNAKLAGKYGISINEDVLKTIDNVFLNLVVVRYMGFGGQIFAVPYTEQFPGWYELWKNGKNEPQP